MIELKKNLLSHYCTVVKFAYQQSSATRIIIATTSIAAGIFSFYLLMHYNFANKVRKISPVKPHPNNNFIQEFERQILKSYRIKKYDQLPVWRDKSGVDDLPVYDTDILLKEIKDPVVKNNFIIIFKIENKGKKEFIVFDIERQNEVGRYFNQPAFFEDDTPIFDAKHGNKIELLNHLLSGREILDVKGNKWKLSH